LRAQLIAAMTVDFAPRLVWNGSASAPLGLYLIEDRDLRIGDYALVEPPEIFRKLIAERGYLPPDTPLIKRVAALSGAEICCEETRILIDNVFVAYVQLEDSAGRELPRWHGCFALKRDEIFLLNDHEKSLDGRYFGATNMHNTIGAAIPVWTWESEQ
jgi:conjugative transfer signal peptidase TraF